ncbi:ABC transporter permease [Paenibacillus glufosinatiresistens]|uniref:ABC transporter permease n=1 Tax=Paenibacillus glufosinatiresistens TaxID=3070657 RepID=UPI00286E0E5C|nr:ABC transporter permease [Paenibacillus sp. YX.27]
MRALGNFASLLHNENIKVYSRIRTWVMLALLVLLGIALPVLFYTASDVGNRPGRWESFEMTMSVLFFLNSIFTVIIASDMVAGEFSWGTIKLLLIRPWSRSKILLSKYLSVVLFSLLTTVLLAVFALGTSFLLFKTGDITRYTKGDWTPATYMLTSIACSYVQLFITAALAFMVSSVFRASGLSIGLSLFLIFANGIIIAIFNPDHYGWAKYLLFNHLDLQMYMNSSTGPGGVTIGFSAAVLAVYYLVFMLISWLVFSKRDVAA